MNDVSRDMLNRFTVVYLDSIFIYLKSYTEHICQHICRVFRCLLEHGLYTKAKGSVWRVKSCAEWLEPNTVKKLQKFLGFPNFYHRFIWGFSSEVAPLTDLLKGKAQLLPN